MYVYSARKYIMVKGLYFNIIINNSSSNIIVTCRLQSGSIGRDAAKHEARELTLQHWQDPWDREDRGRQTDVYKRQVTGVKLYLVTKTERGG